VKTRNALLIVVTVGITTVVTACGSTTPSTGTVSDGSGTAQAAKGGTPTWGQRFTWSTGLAVEVASPVACKPGQSASPRNVIRAVKLRVTIVNGTKSQYEASAMSTIGSAAQFNGAKAEAVYDAGGSCGDGGISSATILPGKTFSYDAAYAVGPQPGELQLTFQPDVGSDKAVYLGKA
jgi:hypothetical protein